MPTTNEAPHPFETSKRTVHETFSRAHRIDIMVASLPKSGFWYRSKIRGNPGSMSSTAALAHHVCTKRGGARIERPPMEGILNPMEGILNHDFNGAAIKSLHLDMALLS